jgi:hypothetical protein
MAAKNTYTKRDAPYLRGRVQCGSFNDEAEHAISGPDAKLVETNVSSNIVPGSGHWLIEEALDQVIPGFMTFLNHE